MGVSWCRSVYSCVMGWVEMYTLRIHSLGLVKFKFR